MDVVAFRQMKDGTKEEYELLHRNEAAFAEQLPDRIMACLRGLADSLGGYQVDRLQHSLQTATRAEKDGADEEMIVAALIHDLGDELAPYNHSQYAASIIRPYVRPEVTWVINYHGLFQNFYYVHFFDGDRHERDIYRDHPFYSSCVHFCEAWDQASFDPDYPTYPLEHFEPMVRRIFTRPAFDARYVGNETLGSNNAMSDLPIRPGVAP